MRLLFVTKFQFHKGTIRTDFGKPVKLKRVNFNFIKVRLERIGKGNGVSFNKFQFHKGTIRTL